MFRSSDRWFDAYKKKGALWVHDDNPRRPHARLVSGKHSSLYFNSRLVTEDRQLVDEASYDLMQLFIEHGGGTLQVQGCVGPATGATKLVEHASEWMKIKNRRPCFWVSPAKPKESGAPIVLTDEERTKLYGQRVLSFEDVLTTGSSDALVSTAVESAGGIILPYILVLVNRSGMQEVNGKRIISLIKRDAPIETPEDCRLCKMGSRAIAPKEGNNWALLNAPH